MSLIGHNRGPTMAEGHSWRKYCWAEARRALLPTLPLEVVRLRVARARAIGLDYKTYATVRASTGQDIVAFLFSSNALRLFAPAPRLPPDRAARLASIEACDRLAAIHRPLSAEQIQIPGIDTAFAAPHPFAIWREVRAILRAALSVRGLAPEGVLVIGDAGAEQDWPATAALAGYLPADRFFAG